MAQHEHTPLLSPVATSYASVSAPAAGALTHRVGSGYLDDDAWSILGDAEGLSLTWSGVSQSIAVGGGAAAACCRARKAPLRVLNNVSGEALAGQTLAIMGPSGAGKTSLLNILAGRAQLAEGSIAINGSSVSSALLRQMSVYVMQDDILLSVLTPREAILFSARLRLSPTISLAEKTKKVDALIERLGLAKCCNSQIRTISGGERKRTSIGVELISDPQVLFLDEPTSGLDATASLAVMRIVTSLARSAGRTIITTIHQPSSELFSLFQRLLLMANGRVAYDGEAAAATGYFNSIGYVIPPNYNPADHFMGVLSLMDEKDTRTPADIEALLDRWQQYRQKDNTPAIQASINDGPAFYIPPMQHASPLEQLQLLSVRALKVYMRDQLRFLVACAQTVLISILMSLVYMNLGNEFSSIFDRSGFFFFAVTSFVFVSSIALVLSMPNERSVFMREQDNKMYSAWIYYFAKVFTEMPLQIFFPLLFTLLVYWTIGLNDNDLSNAVIFWMAIALLNLNGQGVGMLIGVSVPDAITAITIVPLYVIPTLLFSGFFKDLETVPAWLWWISTLSPYKWGLNMLLINEFTGLALSCETLVPGCEFSGDAYLAYKGLTQEDVPRSAVALSILTVFAHILAMMSLYFSLYLRRHSNIRN